MNFSNTAILLTASTAIIALAVFYFPEQSSEPAHIAETLIDSRPVSNTATSLNSQTSIVALSEQEQALLAEVQQYVTSHEELIHVLNPLAFLDQMQQSSRSSGTMDHLETAQSTFDSDWRDFFNGLDLDASDALRARNFWIESTAREFELGDIASSGLQEENDIFTAVDEVKNSLVSNLSEILSPEQMTAFFEHEQKLIMDTLAISEALGNELLETGYYGIVTAARNNDLRSVQAYLASGADPNRLTTDGQSAIKGAIYSDPEILRALITAGADVNLTTPGDRSALIEAASMGNTNAVRILVEAGANVNYVPADDPLNNALYAAAYQGHTEIVRILLDAGAAITDIVGQHALVEAIGTGNREMEQMLIDAGANENAPLVIQRRRLSDLARKLGLMDD